VRILVTGGAGYIGSHAVRALTRAGHQPVVLDNLVYGHADIVEKTLKVPLVLGLMDYSKKQVGLAGAIWPTGDYLKDMEKVLEF
jgi:UDP-glucose 4-epimerase